MRTRWILAALAVTALALPLAAARRVNPDEEAIRTVVGYYFDGGRNGDSTTVARAFNKAARMFYVRDTLVVVPIFPDYLRRVVRPAGSPPDQTQRRIVSIDVAGTAAVAKLELKTADAVLTDYMSLLKIGGQWQIVNKIFDRRMASSGSH